MEHYRSTLATTAIAVFGLVVAAHTLHPGNYEVQPRPVRTVAAAPAPAAAPAAAPSTWSDPPARLAGASETRPTASDPLAPRMAVLLPPGAVAAPALPSEMVAPADRPRRTLAAHRRTADRGPHRSARLRHAGLARTAAADPAVTAPSEPAPAQTPKRIDPIGDLIRGLGLGHDSEG